MFLQYASLLCVLLAASGINCRIHSREGKTTFIRLPLNFLNNKDTLVVFEPVIGLTTVPGYEPVLPSQAELDYRHILNYHLDHYLAAAGQPHQMVRGKILNPAVLKNAVYMLALVNFPAYRFDYPPMPVNFKVFRGKPALIIYHELGYRTESTPLGDDDGPLRDEEGFLILVPAEMVYIRSYALLIYGREVVYYRSNRVKFAKPDLLQEPYEIQKIYKRILNDLFAPQQR